jgi:hypothetical protein
MWGDEPARRTLIYQAVLIHVAIPRGMLYQPYRVVWQRALAGSADAPFTTAVDRNQPLGDGAFVTCATKPASAYPYSGEPGG